MPNKDAAIKALRQTKKRTAKNVAKKLNIKSLIKKSVRAIDAKSTEATSLVRSTIKAVDKATKNNVIAKNKANRLKSRLQKKLNSLTPR